MGDEIAGSTYVLPSKEVPAFTEKELIRFWSKVDRSGDCWIWTKELWPGVNGGYGLFVAGRKRYRSHRVVQTLFNGPIPKGMVVDHTCGVRACVRPEHLRVVTQKQNLENRSGATRASKSGIRGVSRDEVRDKWVGCVWNNGRSVLHKRYDTLDEAILAVAKKRLEVFSHKDPADLALVASHTTSN